MALEVCPFCGMFYDRDECERLVAAGDEAGLAAWHARVMADPENATAREPESLIAKAPPTG